MSNFKKGFYQFDKPELIWKILLSIHQEISFVHPYETNALHFS